MACVAAEGATHALDHLPTCAAAADCGGIAGGIGELVGEEELVEAAQGDARGDELGDGLGHEKEGALEVAEERDGGEGGGRVQDATTKRVCAEGGGGHERDVERDHCKVHCVERNAHAQPAQLVITAGEHAAQRGLLPGVALERGDGAHGLGEGLHSLVSVLQGALLCLGGADDEARLHGHHEEERAQGGEGGGAELGIEQAEGHEDAQHGGPAEVQCAQTELHRLSVRGDESV
mmetsp:Transcript_17427/g.54202  ORF Transcript_17427/g.54202 Transcript_17427/m.54202 type:complete len:234 (-) Transcript_17427:1207-1908(-)